MRQRHSVIDIILKLIELITGIYHSFPVWSYGVLVIRMSEVPGSNPGIISLRKVINTNFPVHPGDVGYPISDSA